MAPRLKQLLVEGLLAVTQVLDLDLLSPREFELVGIGQRQFGPQFSKSAASFSRCSRLAVRPGKSAWALR